MILYERCGTLAVQNGPGGGLVSENVRLEMKASLSKL